MSNSPLQIENDRDYVPGTSLSKDGFGNLTEYRTKDGSKKIVRKRLSTNQLCSIPEVFPVLNKLITHFPAEFSRVSTYHRMTETINLLEPNKSQFSLYFEDSDVDLEKVVEYLKVNNERFTEQDIEAILGFFVIAGRAMEENLGFHPAVTPRNVLLIDSKLSLFNPLIYESYSIRWVDQIAAPLTQAKSILPQDCFTSSEKREAEALRHGPTSLASRIVENHKKLLQLTINTMFVTLLGLVAQQDIEPSDYDMIKQAANSANMNYSKSLVDFIVKVITEKPSSFKTIEQAIGMVKTSVFKSVSFNVMTSSQIKDDPTSVVQEAVRTIERVPGKSNTRNLNSSHNQSIVSQSKMNKTLPIFDDQNDNNGGGKPQIASKKYPQNGNLIMNSILAELDESGYQGDRNNHQVTPSNPQSILKTKSSVYQPTGNKEVAFKGNQFPVNTTYQQDNSQMKGPSFQQYRSFEEPSHAPSSNPPPQYNSNLTSYNPAQNGPKKQTLQQRFSSLDRGGNPQENNYGQYNTVEPPGVVRPITPQPQHSNQTHYQNNRPNNHSDLAHQISDDRRNSIENNPNYTKYLESIIQQQQETIRQVSILQNKQEELTKEQREEIKKIKEMQEVQKKQGEELLRQARIFNNQRSEKEENIPILPIQNYSNERSDISREKPRSNYLIFDGDEDSHRVKPTRLIFDDKTENNQPNLSNQNTLKSYENPLKVAFPRSSVSKTIQSSTIRDKSYTQQNPVRSDYPTNELIPAQHLKSDDSMNESHVNSFPKSFNKPPPPITRSPYLHPNQIQYQQPIASSSPIPLQRRSPPRVSINPNPPPSNLLLQPPSTRPSSTQYFQSHNIHIPKIINSQGYEINKNGKKILSTNVYTLPNQPPPLQHYSNTPGILRQSFANQRPSSTLERQTMVSKLPLRASDPVPQAFNREHMAVSRIIPETQVLRQSSPPREVVSHSRVSNSFLRPEPLPGNIVYGSSVQRPLSQTVVGSQNFSRTTPAPYQNHLQVGSHNAGASFVSHYSTLPSDRPRISPARQSAIRRISTANPKTTTTVSMPQTQQIRYY